MSSPTSSSFETPCSGAARSAIASRKRGSRSDNFSSDRAHRRSTNRGSLVSASLRAGGSEVVRFLSTRPASASQTSSPSVTTTSNRSKPFLALQYCASRETQDDEAASWPASKMKKRESSNAAVIEFHSAGLADSVVVSRNARSALKAHHG